MGAMASKITSLTIVYSIVNSGADQRKHQSSAPLAFVRGIHWWPVNSPHKCPVTWKMFPFDDVIMRWYCKFLVVYGVAEDGASDSCQQKHDEKPSVQNIAGIDAFLLPNIVHVWFRFVIVNGFAHHWLGVSVAPHLSRGFFTILSAIAVCGWFLASLHGFHLACPTLGSSGVHGIEWTG